jgi:hypothetical protein
LGRGGGRRPGHKDYNRGHLSFDSRDRRLLGADEAIDTEQHKERQHTRNGQIDPLAFANCNGVKRTFRDTAICGSNGCSWSISSHHPSGEHGFIPRICETIHADDDRQDCQQGFTPCFAAGIITRQDPSRADSIMKPSYCDEGSHTNAVFHFSKVKYHLRVFWHR